jgi:prepilin-type N-terminal cleavage/methylation domain-containing protein
MWISFIRKKGNTLIEIMIAVTIFSILIMSALSVETAKARIKARYEKKQYYNECVRVLKSNIINNLSYNELKALFAGRDALYIGNENIRLEEFKEFSVSELVQYSSPVENTFLEISIQGEKPVKIIIICHINNSVMNEVITWEFFKGSYS